MTIHAKRNPQLSIRGISDATWREIRMAALRRDMSAGALTEHILREWLKAQKREEKGK